MGIYCGDIDRLDRIEDLTSFTKYVMSVCRPPGAGWATSPSGAAPLARDFHLSRYGSTEPEEIRSEWHRHLAEAQLPEVAIVGVPYDRGSYGLTATAAGPLGVRWAWRHNELAEGAGVSLGLDSVLDLGDIPFNPLPPFDDWISPELLADLRLGRRDDQDTTQHIGMLSAHLALVRVAHRLGIRILSLGGDHSIAASALIGLSHKSVGLIHIDAHEDLSTGREGIPLLHNSWIHFADGISSLSSMAQIGVRRRTSSPPWTKNRLKQWQSKLTRAHPEHVGRAAALHLLKSGATECYLSVDIDVLSSCQAPATGLPDGELEVSDLVAIIESIGREIRIIGADLVEVSPPLSGGLVWSREPTCVAAATVAATIAEALQPRA